MNKRRFKNLTVPFIYALAIFVFGTSMYLLQKAINSKKFVLDEETEYVNKEIVTTNEYVPVINETPTVMKPYLNEEVYVSKSFYDYLGESKNQENSIIFYEDTYMQNSGIDYKHKETFDIISILDGTVIEVTENKLLGKTIKIKHNNDVVSTYQSLSEINVKEQDTVLRGQVIGKSGTSTIYKEDSNLHFELYSKGQSVNPELYYNKTEDEL